ncbi:hypothetical protein SCHPADRAFT_895609 [Schizopora paradoxa]|uniref:Uncharacterized protein n=1 Tax=Schizopora paradoxa TaxID=27342 RepID=A0A0H2RN37_9AGAM|nr:hypothetical protein SCHPADRAFT_895609 [Schizopora paradoxa]
MSVSRAKQWVKTLKCNLALATDFKIYEKGVVSREARALFCAMSAAGCSQWRIGALTKSVLQIFAPNLLAAKQKAVSARTVGRANGEGGIAAEIQLGYELLKAESWTVSRDGTTNKNENIELQHINYSAESYLSGSDLETDNSGPSNPSATSAPKKKKKKVIRFTGVHSSENHKSVTQFQGFLRLLKHLIEIFNSSPFADDFELKLHISDLTRKLQGMHSDHAEDQKKLACLIAQWKLSVSRESLERIAALGGQDAWNGLSDEKREEITDEVCVEVTRKLGEDTYSQLSDEQKKKFKFFGMGMYWVECGEKGQALMPNRDNAAVLGNRKEDELTTPEQERALQVSGRGAVKVLELLGIYLNNSNSKKGQHKQYTLYSLDKYRAGVVYPDTCNTRYHCYIDAAAETIVHLDGYIEFLCHTRDHKEKGNFNHMEENIHRGLLDDPMQTEMIALLLYGEAITYPYARAVCGPV